MSVTRYEDGVPVTRTDAEDAAIYGPPPTPTPEPPLPVSGDAIIGALSKADAAKVDVRDLTRIAYRDDVPASNAKLVRIAKAANTTPDALRAAALGA